MLDYLERVVAAREIEDVWSIHTAWMARYGFDRLLYGYTRFRDGNSLGHEDDILILSNHAKAYTDVFIKGRLYFDAPMLRWAIENTGASSWRRVAENEAALTDAERRVIAFNRSMNVSAGYTISFHDIRKRSKAAIALTGRPGLSQDDVDAIWAEHGREIEVLNNIAHLKMAGLPYVRGHRSLTPRQREALEWIGSGKTTQDTAAIMGLTPATVEKHLRLAREVLNVDTTAHAVLKASVQNQIFVLTS